MNYQNKSFKFLEKKYQYLLHYCSDKGIVVNQTLPSSEEKNVECQNNKKTYFMGNWKTCVNFLV